MELLYLPFTSSHGDPGGKLGCHPLSWFGWCPRHSQDPCWRRNHPADSMEPSVLPGPCHPADTGHSLNEEGQILVGMTCSASSSSGVSVRGARLSCQRGQGWPGLCLLTAGLADLKDLFQPEQFCDSRTLWSKGPGEEFVTCSLEGVEEKQSLSCPSLSPLVPAVVTSQCPRQGWLRSSPGNGQHNPWTQHSAATEPRPTPQDFRVCDSPDIIREGPRKPDPGMNLWDSWQGIQSA